MAQHRVRLDDVDIDLITAALSARLAMLRGPRRARAEALIERLAEGGAGNPTWRFRLSDGAPVGDFPTPRL